MKVVAASPLYFACGGPFRRPKAAVVPCARAEQSALTKPGQVTSCGRKVRWAWERGIVRCGIEPVARVGTDVWLFPCPKDVDRDVVLPMSQSGGTKYEHSQTVLARAGSGSYRDSGRVLNEHHP